MWRYPPPKTLPSGLEPYVMSNLKLLSLNYFDLSRRFKTRRRGVRAERVGYETFASVEGWDQSDKPIFTIRFHGNTVARIGELFLLVTDHGWPTPTTRLRVNAVLDDNSTRHFVAQRKGEQILFERYEGEQLPQRPFGTGAVFFRDDAAGGYGRDDDYAPNFQGTIIRLSDSRALYSDDEPWLCSDERDASSSYRVSESELRNFSRPHADFNFVARW